MFLKKYKQKVNQKHAETLLLHSYIYGHCFVAKKKFNFFQKVFRFFKYLPLNEEIIHPKNIRLTKTEEKKRNKIQTHNSYKKITIMIGVITNNSTTFRNWCKERQMNQISQDTFKDDEGEFYIPIYRLFHLNGIHLTGYEVIKGIQIQNKKMLVEKAKSRIRKNS